MASGACLFRKGSKRNVPKRPGPHALRGPGRVCHKANGACQPVPPAGAAGYRYWQTSWTWSCFSPVIQSTSSVYQSMISSWRVSQAMVDWRSSSVIS